MIVQLFILLVVKISAENYKCSSALEFSLPLASSVQEITSELPKSKVTMKAGLIEEVQGFYLKTTSPKDTLVTMNTCNSKTTLETTIYVFRTCSDDIAQELVAQSTPSQLCSMNSNFPWLNVDFNEGVEYYILFKVGSNVTSGIVDYSISDIESNVDNTECNSATEITSLPYVTHDFLSASIDKVKLQCYDEEQGTLWYSLKGDGKYIVADTCSYYTNFDTKIVIVNSLVDGRCNASECFKEGDDGCGKEGSSSSVVWKSEEGVMYYIGVSGVFGKTGQFELNVQHLEDTLPSVCTQVISIHNLPYTGTFTIDN